MKQRDRENYIYRTSNGDNAFMVSRFNGGIKKSFSVYTIDRKGTAMDPHIPPEYNEPNSRPLYNLLETIDKPYILLVEGERTANYAASYLPSDDWGVVTWSGGAQAIHHTNWLPLEGKTVVCWPDNDDAGRVAMHSINDKYLSYLKIPCCVISDFIKFPHKWDLADDLPDTVESVDITEAILAASELATIFVNPSKEADDLPFDDNVHYLNPKYEAPKFGIKTYALSINKEDLYRNLGYNGDELYFFCTDGQCVRKSTLKDLCDIKGLMRIVPQRDYWDMTAWGHICEDRPKSRPDYVVIAGQMAKECYRLGIFTYDGKMRGRGFWHDMGSLVLHLGNKILVNGSLLDPCKFVQGNYVYAVKEKLISYEDSLEPLTDKEGHAIVSACTKANWSNPLYASLYAGWLVSGLMGGSLSWRPHIWVTGNSKSGKTTLLTKVCKKVIGEFGLWLSGESTEPGIRGKVHNDSRPVCIEESEATDRRTADNIKRILGLIRASSSEGAGEMVKGSRTNGGAESYELRCSFYLTSIGDALSFGADKRRVTVLSLKPSTDITDPVIRAQKLDDFMKASAELDKIPNLAAKLIKRILLNYKVFTDTLEIFKRETTHYFNDGGHGDQIGTLLAGRWILTQSTPVTPEVARKTLEKHDWSEIMGDMKGEREDLDVMNQIVGATIKCELSDGRQADRKISELLAVYLGSSVEYNIKVTPTDAEAAMARFGLRVGNFNRSLQIALTNNGLVNDLMKGTPYESSWAKILRRHPESIMGTKQLKFAGHPCKYIEMPIEGILNL